MESLHCDMVVIGSGPSGQKAAIQGSKLGKKIIMIEEDLFAGGVCLFSGTIPSKSFREGVINLTKFYEKNFFDQKDILKNITISEINGHLNQVVQEERNIVNRQLQRNKIRVITGNARFQNTHSLHVLSESNELLFIIEAEFFVIATGSKPRNPENIPFDHSVIFDSTSLLNIEKIPKSMIILGGGVIGSEYASFFCALGTQVMVIDKKDHILPFLDQEIGVHLQTALFDLGMQFYGNKKPLEVKKIQDHAYVICDDGTELESEILLYALGREANTESLHLKNAGLSLNSKGYLPVNPLFQTIVPHIYAVGDVVGGPCLASTCMEQGRLAARHAFGLQTHYFPNNWPMGIYSIPEISTCGMTEDDAKKLGYHYEVGRAYYYEIARSHIVGTRTGLFKIVFHAETLEILGVHIIGRNATELIHLGQIAMDFRAKIDYFVDQIFNYPTFAEGFRIAALNGINKLKFVN